MTTPNFWWVQNPTTCSRKAGAFIIRINDSSISLTELLAWLLIKHLPPSEMLFPSYKPEHPTYDDLKQILPPLHSTECFLTELPPILCKLAFSKLLGIHYLPHDAQHKSPGVVIWKILIFPTQLLPLGPRMRFHSLENP